MTNCFLRLGATIQKAVGVEHASVRAPNLGIELRQARRNTNVVALRNLVALVLDRLHDLQEKSGKVSHYKGQLTRKQSNSHTFYLAHRGQNRRAETERLAHTGIKQRHVLERIIVERCVKLLSKNALLLGHKSGAV